MNSVYFQNLGAGQGERYFFNMLEENYRRNKMYRLTSSGYWKVTGKDRTVTINLQRNQPIGIKRVLTFYLGRPTCGSQTNWIMHEYCLMESNTVSINQKKNTTNVYQIKEKNPAYIALRILVFTN